MVVLSLFDGMSCSQIALTELGINIEKYYASEIDKFAIAQTQLNFPNTIQLGDITKWRDWDIDGKPKPNQDKASCFTAGAHSGGNHSDMDLICVAMRGRNPDNPSDRRTGTKEKALTSVNPQTNPP